MCTLTSLLASRKVTFPDALERLNASWRKARQNHRGQSQSFDFKVTEVAYCSHIAPTHVQRPSGSASSCQRKPRAQPHRCRLSPSILSCQLLRGLFDLWTVQLVVYTVISTPKNGGAPFHPAIHPSHHSNSSPASERWFWPYYKYFWPFRPAVSSGCGQGHITGK